MVNLTNLKFPTTESKYFDVYLKNLVFGYNIGTASIISDFLKAPALHENSLLNRAINLGFFNEIQDVTFQRTNSDWKKETDNFFYLGALQTVKFIPNIYIQNYMRKKLYQEGEISAATKFANTFMTVVAGMTVFFGIGSLDSKIISDDMKIKFVLSLYLPLFLGHLLLGPLDSQLIKGVNEIKLSLNGFGGVTAGMVVSYAVPDVMHRIGIDKNGELELSNKFIFKAAFTTLVAKCSGYDPLLIATSLLINGAIVDPILDQIGLEDTKIYNFDALNVISLTTAAAASLLNGDVVAIMARLAGTTVAKANAVVGVEIANDYKEDICSFSMLKPVCEYIGIIEHVNVTEVL